MSNPPDKPGLAEVIQLYKDNFGEAEWKQAFISTVQVRLNYEYKEKDGQGS
jgi:hypothetical protein